MKKNKKLGIKKVTLRNLDESTLDAIAGGATTSTCTGMQTCPLTQCDTCPVRSCQIDCGTLRTCPP